MELVSIEDLDLYSQIPIAFQVKERVVVSADRVLSFEPEDPTWIKTYDDLEEQSPLELAKRFPTGRWGQFAMIDAGKICGGLLVALAEDAYPLADSGGSSAIVVDVRIDPDFRRHGLGRQLWDQAEAWAVEKRADDLFVETQNINASACRFYGAMGCRLISVDHRAYPEINEVQIIWGKRLVRFRGWLRRSRRMQVRTLREHIVDLG